MTFCLKTIIIKPEKNTPINNAIILLHGYGGDGKDISMLALNWKRFLTNVIFLYHDAHERCSVNPNGFQWFDSTKEDPQFILEQSIKTEKKLHQFIDEVKKEYEILNESKNKNINFSKEIEILYKDLKEINEKLWKIEDEIRLCEKNSDFKDKFIQLSRDVYFTNDKRSKTKSEINKILGSNIIEIKQYTQY